MPTREQIRLASQRRRSLTEGKNTLGVGSAVRRMGFKGGVLPKLPQAEWSQTVVMGQLNNLTSEPFEGRGMIGASFPSAGGFIPCIQLKAIGGGGLVIELLRVFAVTGGGADAILQFVVTSVPVLTPPSATSLASLDIGGIPTRAEALQEFLIVPPAPAGRINLQPGSPLLSMRAVVAPGSFAFIAPVVLGTTLGVEMIWREIEDAPGAP